MVRTILSEALNEGLAKCHLGSLPDYIPELAKGHSIAAGICLVDSDGMEYLYGDYGTPFTMQSISKVMALILAMEDHSHDYIFQHVGLTSSAEAFNSIKQLETKNENKPLNPFINAGAILTLSLVKGESYDEKFERVRKLTEQLSYSETIKIDQSVYKSEKETGDRNRSLAYFMCSTKVFKGDVEALLDAYFKMCSMLVTCRELAYIGAVLANEGRCIKTGDQLLRQDTVHAVNAIMASCGMYDGSGEFAVKVGIPSKSGVGGGIMSVVPRKIGIGVFGPALDAYGNSVAGVTILEYLSRKMSLNIY